ncbi:MAG: recombinase [Rhodobacteraceae bacterium]|nr:MAG: recombinase [Paracoccaceae bacterium]
MYGRHFNGLIGGALTTIFYARVSTRDQILDHQVIQAEAAGFKIDEVIADHGVSGVKHRLRDRPEGRRLYDRLRSGDTLVLRWLDRLGRNYDDVTDAVRHFIRQGVIIRTVINDMTFDGSTTDPVQQAVRDAMIAFLAATAQAQAEAAKVAQQAGIELAKAKGDRFRGRKPSYDRKTFEMARSLFELGNGPSVVSKETGLSRQTLIRIRDEPAATAAAMKRWGL